MKKMIGMLLILVLCAIVFPVLAEVAADVPAKQPAVTVDLTGIAQAMIALLAALITTKLIPWIKVRTTRQQQDALRIVVDTLVFAAEQLYGSGTGQAKFEFVQEQLQKKGYSIDLDVIEAAVRRMNTKIDHPPDDSENQE